MSFRPGPRCHHARGGRHQRGARRLIIELPLHPRACLIFASTEGSRQLNRSSLRPLSPHLLRLPRAGAGGGAWGGGLAGASQAAPVAAPLSGLSATLLRSQGFLQDRARGRARALHTLQVTGHGHRRPRGPSPPPQETDMEADQPGVPTGGWAPSGPERQGPGPRHPGAGRMAFETRSLTRVVSG